MKTAKWPSFLVGRSLESSDDPVEPLALGLVDQADEPLLLRRFDGHAAGQDLGHIVIRIAGGHQVTEKFECLGRCEEGDVPGSQ